MTQVAEKPQTAKQEEKNWRVAFTCKKKSPSFAEIRKDLLIACWNNSKMADLLYHFLNAASWKAHNSHLDEKTRVFILHETHTDIRARVKISEPTLIAFIRIFTVAGYVRKVARKEALEVNFANIEQAFFKPPDKPVLDENFSSNLSLSANSKNEDSELENLRQQVAFLTKQNEDFSSTLVQLELRQAQFEREFEFNFSSRTKELYSSKSPELALDADLDAQKVPENILDNRDLEDRSRESTYDAYASLLACSPVSDEDYLALMEPSYSQPTTNEPPPEVEKPTVPSNTDYTNRTARTSKRARREPKPVQATLPLPEKKPEIELTAEEQRVFDLYCKLWFIAVAPKLTDDRKSHLGKLAPFIASQADMNSLEELARKQVEEQAKARKSKPPRVVELGNLVNALNAWLAEKKVTLIRQEQASKPRATVSGLPRFDIANVK